MAIESAKPFRAPVDLEIDYARELNAQQYAAVTAAPGPALVIAGAGSGKTRALTYRVAYLLEQGVPAERILLLTFTNKAAREMMRRVGELVGADLQSLWGGTFHSVGARVLRRHAGALGFRRDFTILDREDAANLMNACLEDARDIEVEGFPKAAVLEEICSSAANTCRPVAGVLREEYPYFAAQAARIGEILGRYASRKQAANMMDFDDLLMFWFRLLQENGEARDLYQRQYQFVLVDEYQDTNALQGALIDLLVARHHNIMVVGDDSQSIYAWRGANLSNILDFPKRHPGTTLYKIETNYRSTPEILALANVVIAPNLDQFPKALTPARSSGPRPQLVPCGDATEQAAFVARRVIQLHEEGVGLDRMAVLYRSHFHSLELQYELAKRQVPFVITSGVRFFEQAHIKDVTAWLKFVANPVDELAFKRLARMLPGVGAKAADKLWQKFRAELPVAAIEQRAVDAAWDPENLNPHSENLRAGSPLLGGTLQKCAAVAPRKAAAAWADLAIVASQLETTALRGRAPELIRLVLEAGYEAYVREHFTDAGRRLEDLQHLVTFAGKFPTFGEFLTQLALLADVEAEEEQNGDTAMLRLSTIHQAKGLEFDVVFVIMLCDGLFPTEHAIKSRAQLEEERRLFYVAITRARNELCLSYPLVRMPPVMGSTMPQPSRFLRDFSAELVDEQDLKPFNAYG